MSVVFCSLLWFYKNECKAQWNYIHKPTFRHSNVVSYQGDIKSQRLLIYSRGDVICQQGGDTLVVNNLRHLYSEHDDLY